MTLQEMKHTAREKTRVQAFRHENTMHLLHENHRITSKIQQALFEPPPSHRNYEYTQNTPSHPRSRTERHLLVHDLIRADLQQRADRIDAQSLGVASGAARDGQQTTEGVVDGWRDGGGCGCSG
jgi:hypothetical protein